MAVIGSNEDTAEIDTLALVADLGLLVDSRDASHGPVEEMVELAVLNKNVKVVDAVGPMSRSQSCGVGEAGTVDVDFVGVGDGKAFALFSSQVCESMDEGLIESVKTGTLADVGLASQQKIEWLVLGCVGLSFHSHFNGILEHIVPSRYALQKHAKRAILGGNVRVGCVVISDFIGHLVSSEDELPAAWHSQDGLRIAGDGGDLRGEETGESRHISRSTSLFATIDPLTHEPSENAGGKVTDGSGNLRKRLKSLLNCENVSEEGNDNSQRHGSANASEANFCARGDSTKEGADGRDGEFAQGQEIVGEMNATPGPGASEEAVHFRDASRLRVRDVHVRTGRAKIELSKVDFE